LGLSTGKPRNGGRASGKILLTHINLDDNVILFEKNPDPNKIRTGQVGKGHLVCLPVWAIVGAKLL
jgi:hypothetical protein